MLSSQVAVREASKSIDVRPREAPLPGRKNSSVVGSSSEPGPAPCVQCCEGTLAGVPVDHSHTMTCSLPHTVLRLCDGAVVWNDVAETTRTRLQIKATSL